MDNIYKEIIQDQRKANKRAFIVTILLLAMLLITNTAWLVGFLWYNSQFDYMTDTTTVDTSGEGNTNYIDGNGDITNGEDN